MGWELGVESWDADNGGNIPNYQALFNEGWDLEEKDREDEVLRGGIEILETEKEKRLEKNM